MEINKLEEFKNEFANLNNSNEHALSAQTDANDKKSLSNFKATFTDKIAIDDWPLSLKPVVECVEEHGHQDKMLLASLVNISGILTNIYGIYNRQRVYGNLLLLQFAPPAVARKSEVKETFHLTSKIDTVQAAESEAVTDQWTKNVDDWMQKGRTKNGREGRGLKPKEPTPRIFDIAAKSTSASMYKQLQANNGAGYMRTTEGEVLVKELSKDISDFSELLLYAFQNEPAKKSIATDNTHIRIDRVKLSVLLTMPPEAAETLITNSIKKGLLSRFIIQQLPTSKLEWKDTFEDGDGVLLEDLFKEIGNSMVFSLHKEMERLKDKEIQFVMTPEQKADFTGTFKDQFAENTELFGITFSEFQFRLGLICFKLAMVLSAIQRYDEAQDKNKLFSDDEQSLLCSDKVFHIAKTITLTMTRHTLRCYQLECQKNMASKLMTEYKMGVLTAQFYRAMPQTFSTDNVKQWCEQNNAPYKTVRRWLTNMVDHQVITRPAIGKYTKVYVA